MYSQQRVKASYYADKFHGRKTASGVKYDRNSLTCTHKTYPFGTILKVTNPKNKKVIYVKVNDRGPFIKGRSIDLSYEAAKEINVINKGVFYILIERVNSIPTKEILNDRIIIHDNLEYLPVPKTYLDIEQDNTKISFDSIRYNLAINEIKFK